MLSRRPAWGDERYGRRGERGSGISVLPARHDDNDNDDDDDDFHFKMNYSHFELNYSHFELEKV